MKRLWFAFCYSLAGLRAAWRDEEAFRQEAIAAAILIPAAFYFAPDKLSLAMMVASVLLVLLIELINSAIEAAIDRHGTEIHPLAKKAKDTASAAVLITLVLCAFVWGVCLFN
jgi:diacylglycerol kinase (ATP)